MCKAVEPLILFSGRLYFYFTLFCVLSSILFFIYCLEQSSFSLFVDGVLFFTERSYFIVFFIEGLVLLFYFY